MSSVSKRLGTSPELRMLLTSSSMDSFTICVSLKRKMVGLLSQPALNMKLFRSSCHAAVSYVRVISMPMHLTSHIEAASRASDCRPEPPTPTSSAQPRGCVMTRESRARCRHASVKKTRFIGLVDERLKSARYSSNLAPCLVTSSSSYTALATPAVVLVYAPKTSVLSVDAPRVLRGQSISSMLSASVSRLAPALSRGLRSSVPAADKIVCVLYPDPKNGYPPKYARDDIPKITGYADGTTVPSPEAIDFTPGDLLGCVSGELGLRKFLEDRGHTLVVTADKDGEGSELEKELVDAHYVISQVWARLAFCTATPPRRPHRHAARRRPFARAASTRPAAPSALRSLAVRSPSTRRTSPASSWRRRPT